MVNLWTRVAAVSGQGHLLLKNPAGLLSGLGFGHEYMRSTEFIRLTTPYFPAEDYSRVLWYPSEFMWIGPLFYSGMFVGSMAIVVLGLGLFRSIFNLIQVMGRGGRWFFGCRTRTIGSLGFIAFVGFGFTSDPFIYRLAPLFMGLCMGLLFVPTQVDSLRCGK